MSSDIVREDGDLPPAKRLKIDEEEIHEEMDEGEKALQANKEDCDGTKKDGEEMKDTDAEISQQQGTEISQQQGKDEETKERENQTKEKEDGKQTTNKGGDERNAILGNIREEDVGITEYISQHRGVSAVIKQRYSDFVVNEISTSGEAVYLTNTDVPVIDDEEEQPGCAVDEVLPAEFVTKLKEIATGKNPNLTACTPAGDDKERRQRLHKAVKAAFPNLETKTEEQNGQKVITAMLKGKGRDKRKAKDFDWPSSKKSSPFCRFVMYKENKGTMDVMHLISRFLKVKDSVFSYAGTKDRRAKTTQEVTAFKVHPKKLQDLNVFLRNITLGNFRYVDKKLTLGELAGNRFSIVLRNVVGKDDDLEAGLQSLKSVGFINYYGLQRFGTQDSSTHLVGRAMLREEWEDAVNLIIAGISCEGLSFRKVWMETKDHQKTLNLLESRHYIEKIVLRALLRRPNDFYGAIFSLPRNTRLLYPHSYQSLAWNTMASRRIKTFGLKPIVGDLVLPPDVAKYTDIPDDEQATEEEEERRSDRVTKVEPIVLDETTVSQYTIYDVVLPLPGLKVKYPQNEVFSWYKEHLAQDGLDIEKMPQKHKDLALPGGYRPIVVRPADVEWKTLLYDDVTAPLTLSDIDRMNGVEEPKSIVDGKLKALVLSLTLGVSSYATMALREILKMDTCPTQQASMNVT